MNSQNFWQDNEIKELGVVLTFVYKSQTTYKEPLELSDRVLAWKFTLEDYPMELVLQGIKLFIKRNRDMPVPADIVNIIDPPKKEITQAEYIAAKDWQKRNGYPIFSHAKTTIENFEKQGREQRQEHADCKEFLVKYNLKIGKQN